MLSLNYYPCIAFDKYACYDIIILEFGSKHPCSAKYVRCRTVKSGIFCYCFYIVKSNIFKVTSATKIKPNYRFVIKNIYALIKLLCVFVIVWRRNVSITITLVCNIVTKLLDFKDT